MARWARKLRPSTTGDDAGRPAIAAPSPVEAPARWIGFIDRIDRSTIVGWGFDRDNPDRSVAVEAVASNGRRAIAIASIFRRDVADAGHGNGNHGFEIDIEPLELASDTTIDIRFLDSQAAISTAPISLDPQRAILAYPLPDDFAALAQRLAIEVRMKHADITAGAIR